MQAGHRRLGHGPPLWRLPCIPLGVLEASHTQVGPGASSRPASAAAGVAAWWVWTSGHWELGEQGRGGHTAVFQTQSSKLKFTSEEPGQVHNCMVTGPVEAVAKGKRAVGSCCWLRATAWGVSSYT